MPLPDEYKYYNQRIWKDPYGEPHIVDDEECVWCFFLPTPCDKCGELEHNWFDGFEEGFETIDDLVLGRKCGCE